VYAVFDHLETSVPITDFIDRSLEEPVATTTASLMNDALER